MAYIFNIPVAAILVSAITVLSSNITHASPQCAQIFSRTRILEQKVGGDLQAVVKRPPVKQCKGTCYFESVVSALESSLSVQLAQPITISRPHLFANLLVQRLKDYEKSDSFNGTPRWLGKRGSYDLISSGQLISVAKLVEENPLYLRRFKGAGDLYLENKIIRHMHREVATFVRDLYRIYWGKQGAERRDPALVDEIFKDMAPVPTFEQVKQFDSTAKGAPMFRNDKEIREYVAKNSLKAIVRASLPHVQQILKEKVESYNPSDLSRLDDYKIKITKLNNLFEKNRWKNFNKKVQKQIIKKLEEGKELTLTYFQFHPYNRKREGRPGVLDLPASGAPLSLVQAYARNRGGNHAVVITDVIFGQRGQIKYFVVRNSWGVRPTSQMGYNYISLNYLKHFSPFTIHSFELIPEGL